MKLKNIREEANNLIRKRVDWDSPDFKAWEYKTNRFIDKHFGSNSPESWRFVGIEFGNELEEDEAGKIQLCRKGLEEAKAIFGVYLEEMDEKAGEEYLKAMEEDSLKSTTYYTFGEAPKENLIEERDHKKVFIVHGHDNAIKQEVARLVERQGLEAIILSEQANGGNTIIEKIEQNADVGVAICLFTGDDYGRAKGTEAEENKLRARQNVVFEAGYFMGKLGRKNVIIVADKNLELPSDMQGVVYTDAGNWKTEVLQGLDKIGYAIDFNKLFRR